MERKREVHFISSLQLYKWIMSHTNIKQKALKKKKKKKRNSKWIQLAWPTGKACFEGHEVMPGLIVTVFALTLFALLCYFSICWDLSYHLHFIAYVSRKMFLFFFLYQIIYALKMDTHKLLKVSDPLSERAWLPLTNEDISFCHKINT